MGRKKKKNLKTETLLVSISAIVVLGYVFRKDIISIFNQLTYKTKELINQYWWVIVVIILAILIIYLSRKKTTHQINGTGKRPPIPSAIRKEALERANYLCQEPECIRRDKPELHHIDGNHSNHSIDNLIALCPFSHQLADEGHWGQDTLRRWAKSTKKS